MKTINLTDGLAVYRIGQGEPVLLMPYPHGFALQSASEHKLTGILNGIGRQVITFDPPGSHHSERKAQVDMDEMIACAKETLDFFSLEDGIDVIGHSMGSLCSIGFALRHERLVNRMTLIGTMSGWPAVMKYGQHKTFKWNDIRLYKFIFWGLSTQYNFASLKTFKKLYNLMQYDSFVDKEHVSVLEIKDGDSKLPQPLRMRWTNAVKKVDFGQRLNEITNEVLICVGRYDPQTPVECNKEVASLIENSKLVIFENSGHNPFIEEEGAFTEVVTKFLT